MQRAWRGHRYKLQAYFKEIGGEEDPVMAKSKCHEQVSQEDWDYLYDLWSNSTYKEEMMQLRRDDPSEEMTDKEILESVIGRHSVCLFGWRRLPSTFRTTSSNKDLRHHSYTQLLNTLS